jgi:hypothetical protein
MPISSIAHLSQVADEVYSLQPQRTIELGIGFGLYGVLLRELLDAWYGRCRVDQWQRTIWGIEAWGHYRNPSWDVYTGVDVGDFTKPQTWPLSRWDLVMMMDSLEHLTPAVGRPFLASLVARNKHVIISVPNGPMPQGAVYGNEHEAHRWTFNGLEEFAQYNPKVLYQGLCTVVSIEGRP